LTRLKKYQVSITAANLDVKSTFVSPNKTLEIIEFIKIAETDNGFHFSLKCNYPALKENSIVLTIQNVNKRSNWPASLDYTDISQCISNIGGLVIYPYCIEGDKHGFKLEIGKAFRNEIRTLNISVNGLEQ